jgi:serine/threonine-protein kinase HipA
MMTSKSNNEAFVWIWLPGETQPVVAGKLESDSDLIHFNYGKSYLERIGSVTPAISIYEPELPLRHGVLPLPGGLQMPNSIRDAAPDAWGRRVIINKTLGRIGKDTDTADLGEITYLLESGSDRIGALDFQLSPSEYVPRLSNNARLEELLGSAERVEKGVPLTTELDQALFHASSIGGARPKALIEDHGIKYIAKFSSSGDVYSVVKAEYIAMRLAELAGLNVASVKMVQAAGKDVLLIERFDRTHTASGWTRKSMISALTMFGLNDMTARYASYEDLAEIIRYRFTNPKDALREMFSRLVFNILCGNTDDHARNHAAFWDGKELTLTPAYDICPQGRAGNESSQAMKIAGNNNLSQLKLCLEVAHRFLISEDDAREVLAKIENVIRTCWKDVCDEAQLTDVDKKLLWGRQFLNQFSFEGLDG